MAFTFGVVVFPGSNCEQDVMGALQHCGHKAAYVWHQDTDIAAYDAIILPGGFSYGDYLRCGAVARFSPVMDAVVRFAQAGGPVLGICNGFQILTEAHLLPGALIRNSGLKFLCKTVPLLIEKSVCQWLARELAGSVVQLPINHNEGNYLCDAATLKRLQEQGQIVLRYATNEGASPAGCAPNGSLDNIAGICNEGGNVFGLMPHPERATDGLSGTTGGAAFFNSIVQRMVQL